MKKKIIVGIIWIAVTIFYSWLLGDTGRAMGAQAKSAYENYVEYYTKEYIGAEGLAEAMTDTWRYSQFNDLEKEFKEDMIGIAVLTVLYVTVTLACYHIAFRKKIENDSKKSSED